MLKKALLIFGCLFWTWQITCQEFSSLWEGHFSFNEIVDVATGTDKVYAASENAVFSFDLLTNEINTITTIEGLSGQSITTIRFSEQFNTLLIGYENGLIELYFTGTDQVLSVVDILERENITPINRRINYFYEYENLIYIATNYGISVYDLDRLEFGDTYFMGDGGSQITVNQITVLNNEIYAACLNNNGVKKADLSNPNLVDFSQWSTVQTGNFLTINTLSTNVYAINTNRSLFRVAPGIPTTILSFSAVPEEAEVSDQYLNVTFSDEVLIYDDQINLVTTFAPNDDFDTRFTSSIINNNEIFIGTQSQGVLSNLIASPSEYLQLLPNGPLRNNGFRIDSGTNALIITYGEFTQALNPFPLNSRGLSYFRQEGWTNIPFDSLLGARVLNKITPNPSNPTEAYVSSFHDGLLVLNNLEPTVLYDETNSGLESLVLPGNPDVSDIRVSGSGFDINGLFWSVTSRVERPLKSFDPNTGSWRSYSFSNVIGDPLTGEIGFFDLEIDNSGTKWIGAYTNGLFAFNESKSEPLKNLSSEEQNLPVPRVTALALDQRNQLWIGTIFGLRVLFNTGGFFEDPFPTLNSIIILEDGIPRELLEDQYITDIEVDGSNNKWVGTVDSGVFYFSPNGQQTIFHFTEDNSPLPSNSINDISIDQNNGKVYFATSRGLVAFLAGGSAPEDNLSEAYVYPNPVRPEYEILGFDNLNDITKGIKIAGLTEDVNIKITDIEGNLVAEAQSRINLRSSTAGYNFAIDGGTAVWNGKNLANNIVASGVYVIMITDLDTFETKVLKLLIIR
ncbi:type IX secretion system anionic LPS delivery protein PorZ [Winogradskyella aurantiaca]|uniref:type IX secretion system anionic LPS delivery protein PorZ n=1 Tax=Winogradskyella aurantiaca TaxID=2219558 RepID=UPI000E1D44FB|nr:ABC transporter substrate-binding protein [Winogradskyella aurantiaca]